MANITNFKKVLGGVSGKAYKKILAKSDGRVLWSAGSTVTYVVDTGTSYTEEVDSGASCLSPTTFAPSKDGWTFVGWREDTTASGSVLSSKVMESEPITLYAVFKQTVSANFVSYSSEKTVSETSYYNNGNWTYANITVPTGATYSEWTWRGWSGPSDVVANASVAYANGATIGMNPADSGVTFYGLYQKTITAHFISGIGGTNTQDVQGTSYYNSSGNVTTIDITAPSGASATGWTWRGWSKYWTGDATAVVFLANGGTTTINHENDGITYFGLYQQTITLSYNGNGSTSGSVTAQTGTRYHNSAGNYSDPSFTLAGNGFTRTGYNFTAWNLGAVGASVTLSASATAYAQWSIKNPFTVYAANWASSGNVWTTTYDVTTKESDFVTIDNPYWGVESTYDYTRGAGTIAVKNASNYKTVTINWKQRDWSDNCAAEVYMGASSPGSENGSLYYNRNYTKWFDMSQTFELTNGAKTVYWTAKAGSEDGENDGGVHIAITSVVLNA